MAGLSWSQTEAIGLALYDKFPDADPLAAKDISVTLDGAPPPAN